MIAAVAVGLAGLAAASTASAASGPSALPAKVTGKTAAAPPSYLTASRASELKEQDRLLAVVRKIRKVSVDTPTSGLGGLSIDNARHTVSLAWHGKVLPAVAKEVKAARAAGITVELTSAPFTHSQLVREEERLARVYDRPAAVSSGPQVNSIFPKTDGTGLSVGVRNLPAHGANLVGGAAAAVPGLTSSVALDIAADDSAVEPADTRGAPTPHYNAGQELRAGSPTTNDACSSGFGVHDGDTSVNGGAGRRYLLTAAHCNWNTFYTGNGVPVGRTVYKNDTYDIQLISTGSDQWVWDGPSITEDSVPPQFVKDVIGWETATPGQWVCSSGAFSGANCNSTVATYPGLLGGHQGMVKTTAYDGTNPQWGNGDSGGPVFSLSSDWNHDYAVGMIDAINTGYIVSCAGVPSGVNQWTTPYNRQCSKTAYYIDISALNVISVAGWSDITPNLDDYAY